MAIASTVDLITTALWPQGDIRDPLGVWGARLGVTGDASGNPITVTVQAAQQENAAYIFTCYSAIIVKLAGTINNSLIKSRLLTSWPNVDPQAGVQAYATAIARNMNGDSGATPPVSAPDDPLIMPNDRFLLLFDPRPSAGALQILELQHVGNTNTDTYSFEAYGYYWDRSVLNAPGGPRHPGAS